MQHSRSEYSLRGVLHGRIKFDDYGTEDLEMEIPDITQDLDIFEAFATCVRLRLEVLKDRKGKDLSTLVKNLYKGV
jgi:hypothetical protein